MLSTESHFSLHHELFYFLFVKTDDSEPNHLDLGKDEGKTSNIIYLKLNVAVSEFSKLVCMFLLRTDMEVL